mmetsp:Transcript_12492/g.48661  ORF Transcript_12492/g.48661 Transcript_12492/m.48661 type:complete len:318 (-) Transcript_12492:2624-3577(-)
MRGNLVVGLANLHPVFHIHLALVARHQSPLRGERARVANLQVHRGGLATLQADAEAEGHRREALQGPGGREGPVVSAARLQPRLHRGGRPGELRVERVDREALPQHRLGDARARGVRDAERRVVRGGDGVGARRCVLLVVLIRGPSRGSRGVCHAAHDSKADVAATPADVGDSHLLRGLGGDLADGFVELDVRVEFRAPLVEYRLQTVPHDAAGAVEELQSPLHGLLHHGLAEIDILRAHGDAPGGSLRVDVDVDAFLHRGRPRESLPPAGRSRVGHFRVGHAQHERNRKAKLSGFVRAKGPRRLDRLVAANQPRVR